MKRISLLSIAIKNFRSYKDEFVSFPKTSGLKHLGGVNEIDTRLGANGVGKTSLWDALYWVFYGTSIKGMKVSSLLTWNCTDKAEVVAEVQVDETILKVKRTGPPLKLEVNNKPTTQEELEKILCLSKDRFSHSIIFGQGAPLFPDLSIPSRGDLLEEILDLTVWAKCSDNATTKYSEVEKQVEEEEKLLQYDRGRLAQIPSEEEITCKIEEWEESKNKQLTALKKSEEEWRESLLSKAENYAIQIEELEHTLAPILFEVEEAIDNPLAGQINAIKQQLASLEEEKEYASRRYTTTELEYDRICKEERFWSNEVCPACSQPITSHKKKQAIDCIKEKQEHFLTQKEELTLKISQINKDIDNLREQLQSNLNSTAVDIERRKSQKKEVDSLQTRIKVATDEILSILTQLDGSNPFTLQISQVEETKNPFISQLEKIKEERQTIEDKVKVKETEIVKLKADLLAIEYWKHGFKKIRLYFIRQILDALQIEIQSTLSTLGLDGWKIALATETENKSGNMKLGVQLTVHSPTSTATWEAWSGGEAQRLRLAVALSLGNLIQRRAGVTFNTIIFDEPTSWLSPEGIEDLLECLQNYAEVYQKVVWILDHRALNHSGFSEVWHVVKTIEGSKVRQIN